MTSIFAIEGFPTNCPKCEAENAEEGRFLAIPSRFHKPPRPRTVAFPPIYERLVRVSINLGNDLELGATL